MSPLISDPADVLYRCSQLRNQIFRARPESGSAAARDLTSFGTTPEALEVAERTVVCLDYWTMVTADQLRGIATLIDTTNPGYSIFPIMRSVIEHSAWICWILDNECTSRQRIARANLAFVGTALQRIKTASLIYGEGSDELAAARSDHQRLLPGVEAMFTSFTTRPLAFDGERLLRPTESIDRLGLIMGDNSLWKGVYSYLCSMANHPSLNVIELIGSGAPGSHAIRISQQALSQQIKATIGPYLRSLLYGCAYMGWPTRDLDAMYDELVDD